MKQEQIPFPPPNKGPENPGMKIVGMNFAVFIAYTIILAITLNNGEWNFAAMVLAGAHALVCFTIAIIHKKWAWALAGVMLLVAGFSTCVMGVFSL